MTATGAQTTTRPAPAERRSALPSVDAVLKNDHLRGALENHGRTVMVAAVRTVLAEMRVAASPPGDTSPSAIAIAATAHADAHDRPSQRSVLNLTGTVLHTNLGRAILAESAREASLAAMRDATNLEFDLVSGQRGERDDHVHGLLCELTGAEDAIAVNNNAAAVILVLNTLAMGKEVVVSRGELVEIGGAFRMPDIMARAGARLREIGTTNRTHLRDYKEAIGPDTAALMKVHTSNFLVQGFTTSVTHKDAATVAHAAGLPFIDDLGSGALVDLARYGLASERTVAAALSDGADLVTFSGDKILGGPQAGLVVGHRDIVRRLAKNPLKRAVRLDRMRLAALEATLRLYRDPDRLAERLPTLRLLTRQHDDIRRQAEDLRAPLAQALGAEWVVSTVDCQSETGSGALPLATIRSAGLALAPRGVKSPGRALDELSARFRALPRPILGRISQDRLILDLRCLERSDDLLAAIAPLQTDPRKGAPA
ncbi:MAG: L-seryl-tRNA(Sec) selenium transferase [Hyphomicrobiaceae bacterium]|nr:L-seryl-tRNA(Sec) selenium transferase [Hyphomicrobiaceae bacterium]